MTERSQPDMLSQRPQDLFEKAMHAGQDLPGKTGFICYRKLKRRYRLCNEGIWPQLFADLRAGDLRIDLGATMGEVTTEFAKVGADVIAFEPDRDTFQRLQANVGQMPGATLHQLAAGAQADTLHLRRSMPVAHQPQARAEAHAHPYINPFWQ